VHYSLASYLYFFPYTTLFRSRVVLIERRISYMTNSRIAAVDVGNDAVKANFGQMEGEFYLPNVVARDMADRPVIGIDDLDVKDVLYHIHILVHSPALEDNNAV